MAINFSAAVYETMIDNFAKTLTHEVVTETTDNMSGSEELSYASGVSITGAFFRRGDAWTFEKKGLFENADAILMVKMSVTIKKNDRISYSGIKYVVDHVVTRSLDGTDFYQAVELFQEED